MAEEPGDNFTGGEPSSASVPMGEEVAASPVVEAELLASNASNDEFPSGPAELRPEGDETPIFPRVEQAVLTGAMKVWNLDKGFGFCTMDDNGPDLFVHQSAVAVEGERYRAILPGTQVKCIYYIREGKETARDVTLQDGSPLPGFTSKLEAAQKLASQPLASRPGMLTGTVKFMNKEKGFGFIVPDGDGGDDMFVHVGDIEGQQILNTGEPVQYTTAMKKGNRVQAVQVSCLRPRYPAYPMQNQSYHPTANYGYPPHVDYDYRFSPPYNEGFYDYGGAHGTYNGKVKWFNDMKGFGFIVPDSGGPDVYFKGADVQGGGPSLMENELVTYETKSAPDGKMWAGAIYRSRGPMRGKGDKPVDGAPGYKRQQPYPQAGLGGQAQQYPYSAQGGQYQASQFAQQGAQYAASPTQYSAAQAAGQYAQQGRQQQQYTQSPQDAQFANGQQYYAPAQTNAQEFSHY